MRRRKRTSRAVTAALILAMTVLLLVTLHAGREVVERLDEYAEARTEYADLRDLAGAGLLPPPFGGEAEHSPSEQEQDGADESVTSEIDWDALRSVNPNVVGWIVVPGTAISYPITQGTDNTHYLRHTFAGVRNASGAIFLDYRDASAFRGHVRIHGHNMRDGSMFAPLHGWDGDVFFVHTPDETLRFEVFIRRIVPATDEIYQFYNVDDGVQIVTLSTCVNGRPDMRFVIQAERIGITVES